MQQIKADGTSISSTSNAHQSRMHVMVCNKTFRVATQESGWESDRNNRGQERVAVLDFPHDKIVCHVWSVVIPVVGHDENQRVVETAIFV